MKNLLVLTLVLAMASVANAGLLISVDGVVDPPDSEVYLQPSQEVILDIHGVGDQPGAGVIIGVTSGPGSVSVGNAVNLVNPGVIMDMGAGFPPFTSAIFFDLAKPDPTFRLDGLVADGVIFHCDGIDDVVLSLIDLDTGEVYDTQVIHQPEPMTMALLGLGGLFLRRRK